MKTNSQPMEQCYFEIKCFNSDMLLDISMDDLNSSDGQSEEELENDQAGTEQAPKVFKTNSIFRAMNKDKKKTRMLLSQKKIKSRILDEDIKDLQESEMILNKISSTLFNSVTKNISLRKQDNLLQENLSNVPEL